MYCFRYVLLFNLEQLYCIVIVCLLVQITLSNNNISVNQISEKLILNTNTISPLLQRMEKMNLLRRNRSSKDERSVIITLTEVGKNLQTQAAPIPKELVKILLTEKIKLSEVIQLKDMLNDWIRILSDDNKNLD